MRVIALFFALVLAARADTATFYTTGTTTRGAEAWTGSYANLGVSGNTVYHGNKPSVRRSKDAYYYVNTGIWIFDTSSLPDEAVIHSATLKVTPNAGEYFNQQGCSILGDWHTGTWDSFAAFFVRDASTVTPNAIAAVPFASLAAGVQYTFTLANVDNISRTGQTKIRMHATCPFGDQPTANGTNFIGFNGSETVNILTVDYTPGGLGPRLIVVAEP